MNHASVSGTSVKRALNKTALAVACAMTASGAAQAFNIDTGNPDLSIRLDNSVRYNLGVRTEGRDAKIADNPNFDESDARFDRGDVVTNRLDLLSELDITYKRNFGLRLSGAAWYDQAYRSTSVKSSPVVAAQGYQSSYDGDRYSSHAKRYHRGPSGEILDAFMFANFDVGEVPVNFKAGRHTIYWGESLLTAAHGIAYSQQPVDFLKALNNPGSEVKELYKPLGQISAQLGLTETLWVAGQYYLEWDPFPFPEGGTYLGLMDGLLEGPTRLPLAPGFSVPHSKDLKPKDSGNWGVMARWSPAWLEGTLGFYYRKYDEKIPWLTLGGNPVDPASQHYRWSYAQDVELYGISLSKEIGGVSVGAEVSYRKNGAFNSAAGFSDEGARGNSQHVVVNAMGLIGQTPLFDTASYLAEFTYARWDKVTKNPELFNAMGFAPCAGKSKTDGCITKDYYGIGVNFTPTWFQVLPSLDLKMPMTYSVGLKGNAANRAGGYQGQGDWSIGLSADWKQKYNFTLKYVDYLIKVKDETTVNGEQPISDRGWLVFTFKTSF